ncbi:MAG TPA: hypothetical protein VFF02_08435 [Anaeromyxobacteraceae bacterium]|nr:hypothetical protein [Anaeromyxobacteraceae bacterium]
MNNVANALALAALVASGFLLLGSAARLPAVFATAAAGLEVLIAYGVLHLSVSNFPISLVLAAVLLAAGVLAYLRVHVKAAVSAATIVVLVGIIQVLRGLKAF